MILKKNNIVLIGMTGVGKTTIGKILSKAINYDFIDIDSEIEKASKIRVYDFFIKYGEMEFRKIEKKILYKNLLNKRKKIVSTGAGIVGDANILEHIKDQGISIFLDINLNILIKRLKKNIRNRPLLASGNLENTLEQMYKDRIKNYNKADIKIIFDGFSVNEVISEILEKLICYEKS